MRNTLYFLLFILCSCNSNDQKDQNSNLSQNVEIDDPETEQDVVKSISKITHLTPEENSVIRYKQDSVGSWYNQYDSIVPGVKFKSVKENIAYEIIDRYFDKVKQSGNYLYLTNLDFDESFSSHYDVIIAPISNQLDLIKFVGTEPVNYGLSNQDVIEWFRQKEAEFDFDIIVADVSRIETKLKTNPTSFEKLGKEIYDFCPDVIDQGHEDMNELINYLKSTKHMWFWWD